MSAWKRFGQVVSTRESGGDCQVTEVLNAPDLGRYAVVELNRPSCSDPYGCDFDAIVAAVTRAFA